MVRRPERQRPGRPPARPPRGGRAAGRGRDAAAEEDDPRPVGRGRGERQRPVRRVRPRRGQTPDSSSENSGDEGQEVAPVAPAAAAAAEAAAAEAAPAPAGEGASLVPYQVTPDAELYLKWGWMRSEDIQPTVDAMDDQDIVSLNFVTLLGQDFQQPHFAACLEFIRSYCLDTHTGTVGGTQVALSRQVVRDTFGLRYGLKPMDNKIRHERIQDWFPNRDVRGKRYLAADCKRGPGWAAFMQLMNMILLPRRRIKCIPAHLIFYMRAKIDGSAEDDYDLTSFTVESLRTELVTVRKHLDATSHERYLETFIGMPLTAILIHAGVISLEETLTQPQPVPTRATVQESIIGQQVMQDIGASSSQPLEELVQAVADLEARRANLEETLPRMSTIEDPRPRLVPPETVRGKVLILDLNGLLVRYCSQEEAASSRVFGHQPVHLSTHSWYVPRVGLSAFLDAVRRDFTLIFWTSRVKRNVDALLRDLEERSLIPARFLLSEAECTRYATTCEGFRGGALYLKSFVRLYDYNLATRDVQLVDDSVKKNSTNSPFSAWRQSTIPTPAYVRAHYRELGAQDPIEGLRSYWGDLVTPELSGLLFGDATLADRAIARSLFIGDVPAADVPVVVAGVDDPPVV
ncbi:hypothetical protein R1sor_017609 [Riccia sorocarpa]|uniref:FCP1 homology domain-containing protein n=1 Tax=Riccia sorocarpa TaxID=122646 RepID=A0ABD3I7E3_9MARC